MTVVGVYARDERGCCRGGIDIHVEVTHRAPASSRRLKGLGQPGGVGVGTELDGAVTEDRSGIGHSRNHDAHAEAQHHCCGDDRKPMEPTTFHGDTLSLTHTYVHSLWSPCQALVAGKLSRAGQCGRTAYSLFGNG